MLNELIELQHNKLKIHRGILRLITTTQFMELFCKSKNRDTVIELIKTNNKSGIQYWIKKETGEKNLTELRLLGRKYMIKNYGRISKLELIKELSRYA